MTIFEKYRGKKKVLDIFRRASFSVRIVRYEIEKGLRAVKIFYGMLMDVIFPVSIVCSFLP